jgi:bifunctional non-homologous end joining protein LigD
LGLKRYQAKRKFDRTPEPEGAPRRDSGPLRFVIQKHAASRLHYDLRLEADGVLKSWAVPKGPSLDPADKRLAMMVEDHPLDYRFFEGTIPAGNYGAGTVMVWDEGVYTVPPATDRQTAERLVTAGLDKGDLKLILDGKKLRGSFVLVKVRRGNAENAWLLIKKRDQYSANSDIRDEDRSVLSGRSMEEIAANAPAKLTAHIDKPSRPQKKKIRAVSKAPMPHGIRPMLATLVKAPFNKGGWFFEVKWDGYRAIAEVEREQVRLYSRRQNSLAENYEAVVHALRRLDHRAVLDGEIVAVDERGVAQFNLLQRYQSSRKGRLIYYVFDLLYLDGRDLRNEPLAHRKELLQQILGDNPTLQFSQHIETEGIAFFEAARAQGLEGIVAKRADSPYREGMRTTTWLKIKTEQRQEAVIAGFTEPKGARTALGSLILGVYQNDQLVYVGHVGTGFDEAELVKLQSRLTPLLQKTCPFVKRPPTNSPPHWVRPELVCEVSFHEWTPDGNMRQPVYHGLRNDKAPESVRREMPRPVSQIIGPTAAAAPAKKRRHKTSPPKPTDAAAPVSAPGNVRVPLTNLKKVFWPDEGYTKGDVIAYYRDLSAFVLPYLRDRPLSLNRHPNGINGKNFFQKDVSRQPPPPWVETKKIISDDGRGRAINYMICQNEPTLLYLANLGCIEINPWSSRVAFLDQPDYLLIDLDPEAISFDRVVEAAQKVHRLLDRSGAPTFCKTSGKRGLHIYVPLGAQYDYAQVKQLAEIIARLVFKQLPTSTSVLRPPAQRQNRVYLDYLQNGRGKTLAAPYSVRPWPGATVSAPLKWSEVTSRLDPSQFTIRTMHQRLSRVGDLWSDVLGPGIDLADCLERLHRIG